MRTVAAAVLAAAALTVSACGNVEDTAEPAPEPTTGSAAASTSPSAAPSATASATASAAADAYTPTSDVGPHAAIGGDLAAIRTLLAVAKEGGKVDWPAVAKVFREGGASKKGDGSFRTLAGLSPDSAALALVESALAGTAGDSDAIRVQQVDKGVLVILAEKVVGELESAAEKVAKGETEPAKGAPHNVDEAYAFFVADGQGPAATADKREKKPELAGKVRKPVVEALSAAQTAAAAGDQAGLSAATKQAQSALDYIFYLAVHRYLDHQGKDVDKAEGGAFYLGIAPRVKAASSEADATIRATLGGAGDAQTGRAALDSPEVFAALGLEADQKATVTTS